MVDLLPTPDELVRRLAALDDDTLDLIYDTFRAFGTNQMAGVLAAVQALRKTEADDG